MKLVNVWFLINTCNMWAYVISNVSPDRSSVLLGNHFNVGHDVQTFRPSFFFLIPTMLIVIIDIIYDFIHCGDLDFGLRSQGQYRAKPVGFIFLHILRRIRLWR